MSQMEIIEGISRFAKDMEKTKKMLEIESACEEVGIPVPKEVTEYLELDHEVVGKLRPDIDKGVTIDNGEGYKAIDIDLSKIDDEIDIIRITKTC